MYTQDDIRQIEERGTSMQTVEAQVERFAKGFPWLDIVAAATPEAGINVLDEKALAEAVAYADSAKVAGKCKFVPASGAASRMFKDIFAGMAKLEEGSSLDADAAASKLAAKIKDFAFYTDEMFGEPEDSDAYRLSVTQKVLTDKGLGYGSKPKGVIRFHRYADGECRTAFAEHLVEGQDYMRNADGSVNLTVTISPEHKELFEAAYAEVKEKYEAKYGVKYNIRFTYQDKATDTIAVDMENKPFRTAEGTLLFRPAGHGALIHNLNKVEEELVSIKNIDNVAYERLLPVTAQYKKALMGKCLMLRDQIFKYIEALDNGATEALCAEVEAFMQKEFCVTLPACADKAAALREKLNRPIRVCGMVRNLGEPGGGPFIVRDAQGATSLQILESVQINKADEAASKMLSEATHFNPVDIVCCLKDKDGKNFNLLEHVDDNAGFISLKSFQGRELKALELPGLWNGAMSDWNTSFIEVPVETFNPVKVVLDLLRPAHQA